MSEQGIAEAIEASVPVAGADESASESIVTAAVENEAGQEPVVEATETPKTFTQEELDEIVAKRLARSQRKWEREQQARPQQQAAPAVAATDLRLDQFESPEAYADALADQRVDARIQQQESQRKQFESQSAHLDREEAAREKYDDYVQVAHSQLVPITESMAETIRASDIGPDLAYYLGQNLKEAHRIAKLTPLLQAKEIGRLEAKLAADPVPTRKSSSAPAPITPVSARAGVNVVDTTDPRSVKSMSASEWITAERARQVRKAQAGR